MIISEGSQIRSVGDRNMIDLSDLDKQIEQLRKCEIIKENDVKSLCAKAREILGRNSLILITAALEKYFLYFSGREQCSED